jgi:hypothetical protein
MISAGGAVCSITLLRVSEIEAASLNAGMMIVTGTLLDCEEADIEGIALSL